MGKCTEAFDPSGEKKKGEPYKAVYSLNELQKRPYWSKLLNVRDQFKRFGEVINNRILKGIEEPSALHQTLRNLCIDTQILDFTLETLEQLTIRDLILWGRPFICAHYSSLNKVFGKQKYLLAYLGRAHAAAHIEKEEPSGKNHTRFISTPFGWDLRERGNLDEEIKGVLKGLLKVRKTVASAWRKTFLRELEARFSGALADDRYPVNELTLWDWSLIVAALYKAALAGALLGYNPEPNELRWRLLSVRIDGERFLSESHRLPDLLGRKEVLKNALDEVRELLEVEYPIGLEVYRDENGSIFVVPGCRKGTADLKILDLKDDQGKNLREIIEERFKTALQGEVVPVIRMDDDLGKEPWWGQDPGLDPKKDEPPPIDKHLGAVIAIPDLDEITKLWRHNADAEVCTVCGLRPQGSSEKAKNRHVCDVCLGRRENRAREWAQRNLYTTIWIDEVADINGRVALLVGRFDLEYWLRRTLVNTLAVNDPEKRKGKYLYKTASFVRLHRIWRTVQRFWQEVLPASEDADDVEKILIHCLLDMAGPRLCITGKPVAGEALHRFHAYDMVLSRGVRLSVLWDGERFLTCDNLEYLESERQLGRSVEEELRSKAKVHVEERTGYGTKNREIGEFEINEVSKLEGSMYIPAIPILAEPQTFMALVPADKAVEIVKEIRAKYEREMGKVRNRLPLHLGIVFAHRRTPLRAILDAGRKLLERRFPPEGWTVVCAARRSVEKGDTLPERFERDGKEHFKEWMEVFIQKDDRRLTWYVPLFMGDGETFDAWYPYVFLDQKADPTGRKRTFRAKNPCTGVEHPLVHAEDLRPNDKIFFTPATFDWVWLDTNARRFEIAYDDRGQRLSPRFRQRPYLLDELEILEEIWETLKTHLHRNQIHILRETIEGKREGWGFPSPYDETFRRFCRDLLAEAEWHHDGGKMPWESEGLDREEWLNRWADYSVRGWLSDAVELFSEIPRAGREQEPVGAEEVGR